MKTQKAARLAIRIAKQFKKPARPLTFERLLALSRRLDIIECHIPGMHENITLQ